MIEFELSPHRAALLRGAPNALDVLCRVRKPERMKKTRRLPLNLALVIDRSGSMSGRPLDEARRCAGMILDRLSAFDRLTLIAYDHAVDVLVPSRPVEDRAAFRMAIHNLESRGTTDLHSGWLAGAEQIATHSCERVLSRVLLISDGCANVGITDADAISQHCQKMAEAGVTTSTYGLGSGFNEELMTAMARAGQGSAYYGQSADDLMDPFQEEFDLLSSLSARRLRLGLEPLTGVAAEVLNQYPVDPEGRHMLPDLAHGGEAWAMIRLSVPGTVTEGQAGSLKLLKAGLSYDDLDGKRHSVSARLVLPLLPREAFLAVATDQTVTARATELAAAALQIDARRAAQREDWAAVQHCLEALRDKAADNPWLENSVRELQRYADERQTQDFSKEAMYKAGRMRARLASLDERPASWSTKEESERASFLRRKLEQGRRFEKRDDGDRLRPD